MRGVLSAPAALLGTSNIQGCTDSCDVGQAFGEDVAILAGDALLCLAFEYICRETRGVAPERIVRVNVLFHFCGMHYRI